VKKDFPKIMGILNITPDSFSDGGDNYVHQYAVEKALEMIEDGADIIDIGGESTRPGAKPVSVDDELARVIPVIEKLIKAKPDAIISIDTTKYEVAKAAIEVGAKIINDVSGLEYDERLAKLAAEKNAALVIMHMKGTPRSMQKQPQYDDLVKEVGDFLQSKIGIARKTGVQDIIIDYGIGFGKTLEHNLQLLKNTEKFNFPGTKLLLGISRKSFIDKILNIPNPKDRDMPTALIHSLLLNKLIDIIRVHNVKNIMMLKKLHNELS
jgi:dihydropteroate synthase